MKTKLVTSLLLAPFVAFLSPLSARLPTPSWPQFLGAGSRAVSANADLPDHWSATENIAWKTPISGRGWSSPVAWGDRVFLTTVSGGEEEKTPQKGLYRDGEHPEPPPTEFQWKLLCFDLASGKPLWEKVVHRGEPASPKHAKNSYASETPVTDGERVYACFGDVGLFCFDMDGRPVWDMKLDPHPTRAGWGTASSPILHGDRLYLVRDNEEKSVPLCPGQAHGQGSLARRPRRKEQLVDAYRVGKREA